MAESDSPNFRSKKRKIEDTNFDEPLLSPPLPENVFPDSQPSGSQTVATEIFDLTLVEPETEKYEDQSVWKKVELQSVSAMLQKLDRNLKIVMQQGIESSALGISKSAARIKI
jgi:hypothetical protein